MPNLNRMTENVDAGMHTHRPAFISRVCGEVDQMSHTESKSQFNREMKELTAALHQKGVLKDLQIVGADSSQDVLIAETAQHHKVLIDQYGDRSDDARGMADKFINGMNKLGMLDPAGMTEVNRAKAMINVEATQQPLAQAGSFEQEVGQWKLHDTNAVQRFPVQFPAWNSNRIREIPTGASCSN